MEEPLFSPLDDIPFDEVVTALLDEDQILDPLYLYRLSDISPENLSTLSVTWDSINVDRRRGLIEDLEQLTDTNNLLTFESVFRIAIKDVDDQVRFYATRAIEIFDTDDLIPFFISVLEGERSVDVRAVTASVLGKYIFRGELDKVSLKIKEQIEDTLFQILESDQPSQIKRSALEAISYSSRSEIQEYILEAYNSDDEDWIASAIFAMGRSLDQQFSEMVLNQLQHTTPKIRLEAVRASGELVLEEAIPVILDLLDDLPEIRGAAIWTLSQIGGEDAGPAIHQLLDDEVSEDEVELIQQALERLDFLEDGVNLSIFEIPFSDDDEYILDDYDYTQDDYEEEDFEMDNFDLDDDQWLE